MKSQTDSKVAARTEQTAEFVREALSGWSVHTNHREYQDRDVIYVSCDDDVETNGYAKGSVINTVMQEVPSLVVNSTEDGNMAVSFKFKNE